MTEPKYTPLPWTMSEFPDIDGYKIYGGRTAFSPKPRLLAVVKNQDTAALDESPNNARLFLAAPELLESLKSLRNEIVGQLGIAREQIRDAVFTTNLRCIERRIEQADAVIAKAEGESR